MQALIERIQNEAVHIGGGIIKYEHDRTDFGHALLKMPGAPPSPGSRVQVRIQRMLRGRVEGRDPVDHRLAPVNGRVIGMRIVLL